MRHFPRFNIQSMIALKENITLENGPQFKFRFPYSILKGQCLNNKVKRVAIFSHLKVIKSYIVFLQETHSEPKEIDKWKFEWGGKNNVTVMVLRVVRGWQFYSLNILTMI